ncbi:MAG TPA: c-type cytochrome [Chloroflexi bacterium]|nr:c-type cytochrome [Chloroflexota bacterium]
MKIENYERHYVAGLIITVLLIGALGIIWMNETPRMDHQAEEVMKESVLRGREIYIEQCAFCHGSTGQGEAGPALNNKEYLESVSDRIMFETVSAGRPGTIMPAWAQGNGGPLTDEGIRDLVNFMRLWEENAPEMAEGFVPDPARGMTVFSSSCFICHGENGEGSPAAPAINDQNRLATQDNDWYRDLISYGRPAKGMPTWRAVLSLSQVEDLLSLIDAWRAGETVAAGTPVADLLIAALFELEQGEVDDTIFYLDRAEQKAFGPILENFSSVRESLNDDQIEEALNQLITMNADWPIGNAEEGKSIYVVYCRKCHGAEGSGGIGTSLISNDFVLTNSNSELLAFTLSGRDGTAMGGFDGRLSEEQIADVIALLGEWSSKD